MEQETVMGMVLLAAPVGEYDKRVVILTKEYGKLTAFAKGARRQNSPLLAKSQPFSFGNFQIFRGKNSNTITSAEISNYFEEIRNDLEGIYYAMYFCEFTDYLTRENVDAKEHLKLLYQSLKAISKRTMDLNLVRYIFELRAMAIAGEALSVNECVFCAKKEPELYFDVKSGGLICADCHEKRKIGKPIHAATLYTVQFIYGTPIGKLFSFQISTQVMKELSELVRKYRSVYVDHDFNSLKFLEILP